MLLQSIYKPTSRRGIGLLELMLALAIIAVLIIMATRYYTATSRSQKVAEAASQINAIIAGATNWKIGKNTFMGLDYAGLYSQGLLPREMATAANASPWGTAITVAGTATNEFTITYAGLENQDCAALASRFATNANFKPESACSGGTVTLLYTERGRQN